MIGGDCPPAQARERPRQAQVIVVVSRRVAVHEEQDARHRPASQPQLLLNARSGAAIDEGSRLFMNRCGWVSGNVRTILPVSGPVNEAVPVD